MSQTRYWTEVAHILTSLDRVVAVLQGDGGQEQEEYVTVRLAALHATVDQQLDTLTARGLRRELAVKVKRDRDRKGQKR